MVTLNKDTWYWIRTDGYHNKYYPYYYNSLSQWKVTILDRDLFISNYKLQLLFGRDCIIREVDFEKDTVEFDNTIPRSSATLYEGTVFDNCFLGLHINCGHVTFLDKNKCKTLVYRGE